MGWDHSHSTMWKEEAKNVENRKVINRRVRKSRVVLRNLEEIEKMPPLR